MVVLAGLAVCRAAIVPFSTFQPLVTSRHHFTVPAARSLIHGGFHASQFHSQDELGQASFGYSHPGQASSTFRDAWGNQVGSYAYIDANGKEVRVSFVADDNGFRVVSNNLPEAPVAGPVAVALAPAAVLDTPEVEAAKAAHFAAVAEAKQRNAAALATGSHHHRRRRDLVHHTSPLVSLAVNPLVAAPVSLSPVDHFFSAAPHQSLPLDFTRSLINLQPVDHHVVPHSIPVVASSPHPVAPLLSLTPAVRAVHLSPAVAAVPTITKFHSQDELGQASFGHTTPDQSHSAVRDIFGNQVGSYSYLTPEGKEVRVDYTAGVDGFRVVSNALPEAPSASVNFSPLAVIQEDPDVIAARKAHFTLFEEARNRIKHTSH